MPDYATEIVIKPNSPAGVRDSARSMPGAASDAAAISSGSLRLPD